MDEFAQSREDDDLFADEFEPVAAATTVVETGDTRETRGNRYGPESISGTSAGNDATVPPRNLPTATGSRAPTSNRPAANNPSTGNKPPAGPRNGRGGASTSGGGGGEERKGGRGGNRGGGGGGLGSSRYAVQTADDDKPDTSTPTSASAITQPEPLATDTQSTTITPSTSLSTANAPTDVKSDVAQNPPSDQPQPPTQPQQPFRPTAVRGDRHLTGGPAHKKLTEAELSEKMEKMKILNAQKAERFRLSEEDSAAYARKEKEMAKKRVEEQKNARAMDMERAKNRQRKLAAQGGREWDSEKQESDIVDGRGRGRSSEYVRGGHGGVIRGGLAGSRYAQEGDEFEGGQSFRGRGGFEIRGRGNRGGRGGARGGKPSPATVPTPDDFPELPTPAKPPPTTTETVKSPIDKPAGDWAEEMATPVEEKKIEI